MAQRAQINQFYFWDRKTPQYLSVAIEFTEHFLCYSKIQVSHSSRASFTIGASGYVIDEDLIAPEWRGQTPS